MNFCVAYDYTSIKRRIIQKSIWSSGMIPALGAGGPGFNPRNGPFDFVQCGDPFHSQFNINTRCIIWPVPSRHHHDAHFFRRPPPHNDGSCMLFFQRGFIIHNNSIIMQNDMQNIPNQQQQPNLRRRMGE